MRGQLRACPVLAAVLLYGSGWQLRVTDGNVADIGVAEIVLGEEDRSAYGYEYRLDTTVSMAACARHPELGKLINARVPASYFTNGNDSLFAPSDLVASAEVRTPKTLAAASEHGDVATARELLAGGADPNTQYPSGWTPLMMALRYGPEALATRMLEKEADGALPSADGTAPVALAKKEGYFEIVQRLGDDPADVEPAFAKAAPAKGLTYSRVVATYPAGVKPCTTVVDVTSASPTCQWQTLGIVEHRNHQPLLHYYGTHVRLKVPARVGGVTHPAGTLLTLDEDQSWVAVTSWD